MAEGEGFEEDWDEYTAENIFLYHLLLACDPGIHKQHHFVMDLSASRTRHSLGSPLHLSFLRPCRQNLHIMVYFSKPNLIIIRKTVRMVFGSVNKKVL